MDKNKTLNNVKRAINALPLNQAYRDSLNNTFKELVDNSGSEGGNTPSDPSSGGSNDYVLPFTTEGNFDLKYFDEIKEAINSGKTIKHKNSNGSYRTIDYTIVKDEYIYCFIGNFDENTQIIDISKSGYAFEYNICAFNSSARQTININANLPAQANKHTGYEGHDFGNLLGYNLNIFDVFTGNCKKEDDIYTIYFSKESINVHRIIAQCIVYTNSDNEINVVILNMQNSNDNSLPGFVFGHGLTGDYGYEVTDYGDVSFVDARDYRYEGASDGHFTKVFLYPNEKISTLVNNKLVKFKIANGECIYKNNTLDQLLNELTYNQSYVQGVIPANILKVHDLYIFGSINFSSSELYECRERFVNSEMVRFIMQGEQIGIGRYEYIPYVIYRCNDAFNYYAHKNAYTDWHFKFTADNNGRYNLEIIEESSIPEVTTESSGLMPASLYNKVNNIINGEVGIYILNLPELPENNEPFENQNKIAKDIIKAIDENKQIVVKYSMEDEGTKSVQWNNINFYTYTLFEDSYTINLNWGITMSATGESMFEFTHYNLTLTNDNCYFEQKTARLESID